MPPNRGRNRAEDVDDSLKATPNDSDPEADDEQAESSDDGSAVENEGAKGALDGARDHYVHVGKSKLREPKSVTLGRQYRGAGIRRDAMVEDEDDDDPFSTALDEEESEDEVNDGSDMDGEGSGLEEDEGTPDTAVGEEESALVKPQEDGRNRAELLRALRTDQRDVASSLAKSARVDGEKGRAVKHQRAAFDSLLNCRIRLQKTLVGANTIVGAAHDELENVRQDGQTAIETAEMAAFNLCSSLHDFRDEMIAARTGEKRKKSAFSPGTTARELWAHVEEQDGAFLPHRNAALQRWSAKTQSTAARSEGLINKTLHRSTIIDAIQEHLSDRRRLLKRTHTPRSCAPLQLANKIDSDDRIYDDADFYGLLLKELLEQKSQDSVAASNIDLNFNLHREAKTKKNVDTRASKGRKLRYTVHEKLQNFMAPEDRSTWGERQTDDLFKSLVGQQLGLGEDADEDEEMERGDEVAEGGLMLFRS